MTDTTPGIEPDRPVISVMRRMRPDEMDTAITAEVHHLRDVAASSGLAVTGDPFGVFHGPVTTELDGPLEIALPVDGLASIEGDVRSYRLPGGLMANRYAEGPETWFPDILAVYDEVHSWITQHGGTPVGPPRELWHSAPTDPQPLRLTISWPYAVAPT